MSWEQRFREMVLAGGASVLTAVGCGDRSGAGGAPGPDSGFCCNANGDPCCPSLYCGVPVTAMCTEKMTCESDGGMWSLVTQGCSRLQDSGLGDAPLDAPTDPDAVNVVFPCCNANADPCCQSLYCGETVTVQCIEKMACETDGGTWNYGVPGCALDAGSHDATSDAPEAGPSDAAVDVHGQPD